MSAFEQSGLQPGDNVLAGTVVHKLLRLIPAAGAMAYPFLLDGFHLAVSPTSSPTSAVGLLGAALCLFAATAAPFLGLVWAFRMSRAMPSSFELRARRLAYATIGAPPLFVLTGVGLGLLHIPLSDELVWVIGWSAACLYVALGNTREPASFTQSVSVARPVAKWRVAHGVAAALFLSTSRFTLPIISSAWRGRTFMRQS